MHNVLLQYAAPRTTSNHLLFSLLYNCQLLPQRCTTERAKSEWRHRLHDVVVRGTCSWFVYHPNLSSRRWDEDGGDAGSDCTISRYHPTTGPEFPSTVQQFMAYATQDHDAKVPHTLPQTLLFQHSNPTQNVNNGSALVIVMVHQSTRMRCTSLLTRRARKRKRKEKEMEHFQSCVSSISVGNTSENTRKTRLHDRLDWLAFCDAK